jgi:hypothetical protein
LTIGGTIPSHREEGNAEKGRRRDAGWQMRLQPHNGGDRCAKDVCDGKTGDDGFGGVVGFDVWDRPVVDRRFRIRALPGIENAVK